MKFHECRKRSGVQRRVYIVHVQHASLYRGIHSAISLRNLFVDCLRSVYLAQTIERLRFPCNHERNFANHVPRNKGNSLKGVTLLAMLFIIYRLIVIFLMIKRNCLTLRLICVTIVLYDHRTKPKTNTVIF